MYAGRARSAASLRMIVTVFAVIAMATVTSVTATNSGGVVKKGRVALTSKDFSATGTAGKPAVVNFKLDEGHHRMADIVVSCFAQLDNHDITALLATSKSSSTSSAHENGAEACAGAEVFLRMSPGMAPHVAFTIVNDDGPIMSAPSRDGWNGITSHGVSKRCTKYSFDECSLSRDVTYTTSYKDLDRPAEHGMWYAATTPANAADNKTMTLEAAVRSGFFLVDSVPADLDFDARMAGTMYRINTVARHLLIEFKAPPELAAEGAYLQLEVRLTGTTSGQTMLIGLLCVFVFFTVLGNALIGIRKYALRTRPIHMHLTPRVVWSLRRGPGPAGAPGLPIVPDITLPEIVGKPVTPSRLEPKRRRKQQEEQNSDETSAAAAAPSAADNNNNEAATDDGESTTPDGGDTELAAIPAAPSDDSEPSPAAAAAEEQQPRREAELPNVQAGGGADFSALVARLRSTMAAAAPGGARAVPIPAADDDDEDDEELLTGGVEGDAAAETRALAPKPATARPTNGNAAAADDASNNGWSSSNDDDDSGAKDDDSRPAPAAASSQPSSPQPPRAPLPPGAVTVVIPDSNSDSDDLACRICQDASPRNELFAPCACAGSSKYVHKTCLEQWRYSTNNAQHRGACAECKTKYTTKEDLERQQAQQQQATADGGAPTTAATSRLAAFPRIRCCLRCAGSMGPPIYTAILVMLFGGYAVKFGAFVITGFDSGVEWVPNAYHFMLGAALVLSELITVAQLSHYFSGYPIRNARVALFVLGYVLPFAFGYVAMFFVWMIEITLLRREVSYISGVVCAFACSQYFLPTLNEAVARAEIEAWFHGAGDHEEGMDEQALRDALGRAVRDAHREAQRQHQEANQNDGPAQPAAAAAPPDVAQAANGDGSPDEEGSAAPAAAAPDQATTDAAAAQAASSPSAAAATGPSEEAQA